MNHDEILQAAKEADACHDDVCVTPYLRRFASIIEKRTIERCAVAADAAYATDEVIAAIRKLGEQK